MLMQWRGPFKVLERVEGADYCIQVGHKQKVFHANLLKRYLTAEPESPEGIRKPADPTENESEAKEVQSVLWEKVENLKNQGTELETLNSLQKETVKDVKINPKLSEEQQAEVRVLLVQYTDIFTDVPSIIIVSEHVIQLNSTEPIKGRAYSLPHSLRETLNKEIDNMLAMGIIEESTAAYASPVVMVEKPNGTKRVCVDNRRLNCVTVFDPEPMPTSEEIFAKLSGDRF